MAKLTIACLMSSAAFLAAPAMAQTAETADPQTDAAGDIVVTAQRRVERVQDVPISISVVSGDQLDRQQVLEVRDLARTNASVNFGNTGSNEAGGGAFIRGIGTAALTRSAEAAVGIVVDGVVQGNTNVGNLFDISRVEVLRGPQGTLFGQSVSAGVINMSTVAPDPSRVSGKVSGEFAGNGFAGSEYGRLIVRGALNLPLSSDSAIRVSAFGGRTKGVLHNTNLKKDDRTDDVGVRARFKGQFGNLTVNLIGDYSHTNLFDGGFFTLIDASPNPIANWAGTLAACGVTPRPGNFNHCSSPSEVQRVKTYGGSAQFDLELGDITVTSITALRKKDIFTHQDVDRTPVELNPFLNIDFYGTTDYQQFTQEIRVASDPGRPFSFTLGGFYYKADTANESGPQTGVVVRLQLPFLPFPLFSTTYDSSRARSENLSAFGEARYKSGPFTVFAGGRLTGAKQRTRSQRQNINTAPFPGTSPLVSADNTFKDTDFSWRVGAQYAASPQLMAYATLSRGYKNAQVIPVLFLGTDSLAPIVETTRVSLPEKPMAFELGLKSTLLNGRLLLNIDGFYQDTKNLQTQTWIQLAGQPFPSLIPGNASKVISKGIEADVYFKMSRSFTLSASATYNVAKYPADYFDGENVSLKGEQIAQAPRFAATISGEYAAPISGDVEGFISLDGRYRSKVRLADSRLSPQYTVDKERFTLGGRLGVRLPDRWSAAIFANNITGTRIPSVLLPTLPSGPAAFYSTQAKREVGLQAELEF